MIFARPRAPKAGWRLWKTCRAQIADPYRWLEDANSAETQEFVRAELAYTRGILDPLPGRDRIHQELTELLSIGSIGTPQVGGKFYFYIRREGTQNQPVLLVREGLHGKDRALVDVNQMSCGWHGRAGLVVAFGRWQVCGLRHFVRRVGREHSADR